jgi:hypothetical protein
MSIPDTFKIEDIANYTCINLYKNGSDNRQQKNGSPNKLKEECLNKITIATIGVYTYYLTDEQRKIITSNDKSDYYKRTSVEFLVDIAKSIIKALNEMENNTDIKKSKVCVYIPYSSQREMLYNLSNNEIEGLYKHKDLLKVFDPRKLFFNQERTKTNSMYGIRVK